MYPKGYFCFGVILIVLCFSFCSYAQYLQVRNVRFEDNDETISVYYDLDGMMEKSYNVSITLSDDFGNTFKVKPKAITGDVGKNIKPGKDKTIIWYVKEDFPDGLSGQGFVFAVDAKLQRSRSKLPIIIGGTGIVASIIYFLTRPKEGSIVVEVPREF
jgi:hypothetical protein